MANSIDFIGPLEDYTRVYQKRVKNFSGYADLKNILGLLYYLQGKNRQALVQFEGALSINPCYEEAFINRCFVLNVQGKGEQAVLDLKAFISKDKSRRRWSFLALSIIEFQRGHVKQALGHILQSLKKNSEDPYFLVVAGMCYCANGKKAEAKKMFHKAQSLSYVISNMNKELEFYKSGDFCLKNMEKLYPYFIRNPFVNDLLVRIAEELAKSEKMDMARKLIHFSLTRGASSSRLLNFLGIMALKEKRVLDAVRLFHSAFKRDKCNAYPAIHLFFIYGEKGEWDKAKKILGDALRFNPGYADLHNYKGMFLNDFKRKPLALIEFQRAVKINPCYLDALYNLSQLYEDMERFSSALEVYRRICLLRKISVPLLDKIQSLYSLTDKKDQKMFMKKLKASTGKKIRGHENLKKVYQHLSKKSSLK